MSKWYDPAELEDFLGSLPKFRVRLRLASEYKNRQEKSAKRTQIYDFDSKIISTKKNTFKTKRVDERRIKKYFLGKGSNRE
nr:Uncharacterized protein A9P81_1279 [Leptospira interrogans serovar Copenhageni/Icterohaemorrhagiae]